ncbi:MAG: hypothetical protein FWC25_02015 [Dehalococcoidia bacterium]|nr:hypothetical protein [Dehalococcoidia bacterium]
MKIKNYPGAKIKPDPTADLQVVSLAETVFDNTRWKLGGCPRCYGDVFLDSEDGQTLSHCLQCGYVGVRVETAMKEMVYGK